MKKIAEKYRLHFRNNKFLISLGIALIFLTISIFVNYFASQYATEKASNSVTDIILSNIQPWDVGPAFLYGPLIFWFFIFVVCLLNPQKFPFVLKCTAIFIIIRSIFMSLTHLGPFPTQDHLELGNVVQRFVAGPGADLFFSSHTGMPFLMALIFWKNKYIRFLSLVASLFFGVIVLLGHYHYSIDVLAAFFITYSIFNIAVRLFKKDKEIFDSKSTNF